MNQTPYSQRDFLEEKRKLLYWIARRIDEEAEFDNINFDIPEMSVLLQSMGFRLDTFEKTLDDGDILRKFPNMADKNIMKVELTCPKSGMRSTLIKQTPCCKCPSEEEVDKGQFWSVTGCGPSSQTSINSSNSSLLPTITSAKTSIIKVLLLKILMVINGTDVNNENDDNLQPVKNVTPLTRHHSLDALKGSDESGFVSNKLKRGPSWEVDPKTSPPTDTSSPVPNLCATMSRVSINSGQSNTLIQNLESIKKLVDETLELASGGNATFVKNTLPKKRVSDIKPHDGPSTSDLVQLSSPITRIKRTTTPRRLLTPKKNLPTPKGKGDGMAPPSKIAMFRKKTVAGGVSPNTNNFIKKDTPRPRTALLKTNVGTSGSCESIFKSKISTNIGIKGSASPKYGRGLEAGTSGISKLKSVGKLSLNAITPTKKKT